MKQHIKEQVRKHEGFIMVMFSLCTLFVLTNILRYLHIIK
jgi:hypothetical protein